MEYWDDKGLSRIASKIGVPLFMDYLTSSSNRISFARVCLEINVDSELPQHFFVRCEEEVVEIKVEYQGIPTSANTAKGKNKIGESDETVCSQPVEHTSPPDTLGDPIMVEEQRELEETEEVLETEEELLASMVVKMNSSHKQARQKDVTSSGKSSSNSNNQRKKKRGFNESSKIKEVRNFVLKNDIEVMGLLKIKIKPSREKKVFDNFLSNWGFLSNSLTDGKARVWVCWDPTFCDIQCIKMSSQYIFCKIIILDGDIKLYGLFVYAENKHVLRVPLFKDILALSSNCSCSPLVCLGDFNSIRCPTEKVGGSSSWIGPKEEFNTCILFAELTDLSHTGCQFTWANKRGDGAFITSKLDRALVIESWLTTFPHSSAIFLPSGISDDFPCVVDLNPLAKSFVKPFKFFDFLRDHEDFIPSVSSVWCKLLRGSPMFRIFQKLKAIKPVLKAFNKREYSEISTRVNHAKSTLENAQIKLDKDPLNTVLQNLERDAYSKYVDLSKVEKGLFHQKSRIQWLGLGDRNTRFFFRNVKGNTNMNKINSVTLNSGEKLSKFGNVSAAFVQNFSNLFGAPFGNVYNGLDRLQSLVDRRVTSSQFEMLSKEVTDQEIKDTFWSLKANKALGPDGFPASFFRKAWDVVGKDVVTAIKSFFTSRELLQEINNTMIALVPKVPNPSKLGDYRPISCCNTIYKCIAKIIANSLKMIIPDLVDPVQSAFVQGRRISDNIFLSQELMRGYHRNSSTPRCTMKVDIIKAYDNVRWDFMIDVLRAMGFPPCFIHWIRAFDLMIFCKGDTFTVRAIKKSLVEFQTLSGLSPSPNKSHVFFSGCEKKLRDDIMNILQFPKGFLPIRYLGVPLIASKLKACDCKQLVERITKRIKSWTNKCLSYAGSLQLIQSIIFSMQVYWASLFILSRKVVKEIESLFGSFLWSGSDLKKHEARVYWDKVCSPKKEWGLGLISMEVWNRATIAKHAWFLFSRGEQSMWCQWVKSYLLKGRSFWKIKVPSDSSWVWRKILGLRPIIYPHMKYIVGDGQRIFLGYDNWHPLGSLWAKFGERIMYNSALNGESKVSRIISNLSWKWPFFHTADICELIQSTPHTFIPGSGRDKLIWIPSSNGEFSIKSAWNAWRLSFDKKVWLNVKDKLNVAWPVIQWPDLVSHISKTVKGMSLGSIISRLGFTCSVYLIWLERNNRIFTTEKIPEEVVTLNIFNMIRFKGISDSILKIVTVTKLIACADMSAICVYYLSAARCGKLV
ncbi:uncharacterized protein LOC114266401 [Camellia sinensis]|uniref:uncharacterized protein LOC114266401 n=1 Tax=Camellia sinensis TaxID=4442 RepID=UPI0010368C30|nr:uncharacterized protein LOC114266401 [Camellia sinensis]